MCDKRDQKHVTLADRILRDMRDQRHAVSLYLVSGFQLKGEIVEFDEEAILFEVKNIHQLVMRSAVASLYPILKSKGDSNEWWRAYVSSESKNVREGAGGNDLGV